MTSLECRTSTDVSRSTRIKEQRTIPLTPFSLHGMSFSSRTGTNSTFEHYQISRCFVSDFSSEDPKTKPSDDANSPGIMIDVDS